MNKDKERRSHKRVLYSVPLDFTVLSMRGPVFRRIPSAGTIVNASKGGVGIITGFPLQPGQVLQWDDRHKPKRLHIAIVKWSQANGEIARGGLTFL